MKKFTNNDRISILKELTEQQAMLTELTSLALVVKSPSLLITKTNELSRSLTHISSHLSMLEVDGGK
jgi:hypothetical protein